jgi:hypothetical protein
MLSAPPATQTTRSLAASAACGKPISIPSVTNP